jgi:hypothetical protein
MESRNSVIAGQNAFYAWDGRKSLLLQKQGRPPFGGQHGPVFATSAESYIKEEGQHAFGF